MTSTTDIRNHVIDQLLAINDTDYLLALSKMIDHSLLHPTMTDEDLRQGCALAKAYNVATVCIKPYAIKETNGNAFDFLIESNACNEKYKTNVLL